jgi:hypothetical protein
VGKKVLKVLQPHKRTRKKTGVWVISLKGNDNTKHGHQFENDIINKPRKKEQIKPSVLQNSCQGVAFTVHGIIPLVFDPVPKLKF